MEVARDALSVEGEGGEHLDVHFEGTRGGTGGDGAVVGAVDTVFTLDGIEGEQALLVSGDAV